MNNSNRTVAPLQYPPHVIALASIYLAALLSSFEQPPPDGSTSDECTSHEITALLKRHGRWEKSYKACVEDLEGVSFTRHLYATFFIDKTNCYRNLPLLT